MLAPHTISRIAWSERRRLHPQQRKPFLPTIDLLFRRARSSSFAQPHALMHSRIAAHATSAAATAGWSFPGPTAHLRGPRIDVGSAGWPAGRPPRIQTGWAGAKTRPYASRFVRAEPGTGVAARTERPGPGGEAAVCVLCGFGLPAPRVHGFRWGETCCGPVVCHRARRPSRGQERMSGRGSTVR
jgi:hypothetical protein